jgi:hypothetical protein
MTWLKEFSDKEPDKLDFQNFQHQLLKKLNCLKDDFELRLIF